MNGKSKSILLQVAFKEAVGSTIAQGIFTEDEVELRTGNFYGMLIGLHDKLGIDADDAPRTGGGGNRRAYSGGNASTSSAAKEEVSEGFFFEGQLWRDYRTAKDEGKSKAQHPDFKGPDGTSIWLIDRDGNPNEQALALVAAADSGQ